MRNFLSIAALLCSSFAQANLVDEVDKLTPEQAYQVQNKLSAKLFEPIPQGFFTDLTVSVSSGVGVYDPKNFNSYLAVNQAKVDTAHVFRANLLWKLSDQFLFGLGSGMSSVHQTHEPSPNVFHRLSVMAPFVDLAFAYRVDLSSHFYLLPAIGLGATFARVSEETTNDTARTTYVFRYHGAAFHGAIDLPIYLRLNRIWSLGLVNTFQLANITGLERNENHSVSVPNLSLTGYQALLSLAFNI